MIKRLFVCLLVVLIALMTCVFSTVLATENSKSVTNAQVDNDFDINGDGYLNSADYRIFEKYLANYDVSKLKNFDLSKCDCNGDGEVNFLDLNMLGNDNKVFAKYSPRY